MWNNPGVIILAGALVITAGVLYEYRIFSANPSATSCIAPAPVIAAFGDSLVSGYGATTAGGFVSMLSTRLGTTILNNGKNGETSAQALTRIDEVIGEHPSIVILLVGGNDALQNVPLADTERNLDAILTRFKQARAHVVLVGVLGGITYPDPYQEMFKRLAKAHEVSYIPNILSGLVGNTTYMSDPVHPNEAGYQRIADRMYPALLAACKKVKS